MKNKLFVIGALFFATGASAQVSTEITKDEFNTLLSDKAIAQNWNTIKAMELKNEVKTADQNAVYTKYLTALRESVLNNDAAATAILQKEIEAVEHYLNPSKK